jgi:predicted RNase H-like nuclease (RuvC/YqgF family)
MTDQPKRNAARAERDAAKRNVAKTATEKIIAASGAELLTRIAELESANASGSAGFESLRAEWESLKTERDELNRQLSVALKGKRPYSAEFADETIAAQVKRIAELEEKLNGWFSERDALRADAARLRTALEGMLIAEMELRQMEGFGAAEVEAEPHWIEARAALAK